MHERVYVCDAWAVVSGNMLHGTWPIVEILLVLLAYLMNYKDDALIDPQTIQGKRKKE